LRLNLHLKVTFHANIYGPLDRGIVTLQLFRWKFYTEKLCSRHYLIEVEFYFLKSLFEPPFHDVAVTYAFHL